MTQQDERIAAIVRNRFLKSGASVAESGLLEEVSVTTRCYVQSNIGLDDGEILLIASVLSLACWAALTTRRLVVATNCTFQSVPWENISDVVVDFGTVQYSSDAQPQLSQAKVVMSDGKEVCVNTFPGEPFIGFWNCLILAKQMGEEEARRRALP